MKFKTILYNKSIRCRAGQPLALVGDGIRRMVSPGDIWFRTAAMYCFCHRRSRPERQADPMDRFLDRDWNHATVLILCGFVSIGDHY